MKYSKIVKNTLHLLNVSSAYSGFDYIVDAIEFIEKDKDFLNYIIKSIYFDIARKHHTSWRCVERNVRTVVKAIWNNENNLPLIIEIFGEKYRTYRPANKEFLELLHEYVSVKANVEGLLDNDSFVCPLSGARCELVVELIKKLM